MEFTFIDKLRIVGLALLITFIPCALTYHTYSLTHQATIDFINFTNGPCTFLFSLNPFDFLLPWLPILVSAFPGFAAAKVFASLVPILLDSVSDWLFNSHCTDEKQIDDNFTKAHHCPSDHEESISSEGASSERFADDCDSDAEEREELDWHNLDEHFKRLGMIRSGPGVFYTFPINKDHLHRDFSDEEELNSEMIHEFVPASVFSGPEKNEFQSKEEDCD